MSAEQPDMLSGVHLTLLEVLGSNQFATLVRSFFKLGGMYLINHGVSKDAVDVIVGGIVSITLGLILSYKTAATSVITPVTPGISVIPAPKIVETAINPEVSDAKTSS